MDFQAANFLLEGAIDDLKDGRLSDTFERLSEVVRLNVKPSERQAASTLIRMIRSASDGGDWRASAAKAKIYNKAGAKKAGARAFLKAHGNTINPPKNEGADNEPSTQRTPALNHPTVSTDAQRNKPKKRGLPDLGHFVDPLDPAVKAHREKTKDYFNKWSSPPAKK